MSRDAFTALMNIAILTFQGFNELDSLMAFGVLNRIKRPDWRVTLCCPEPEVTSMNGVTVRAQSLLEDARAADAVIIGSGMRTREIVGDAGLMGRTASALHYVAPVGEKEAYVANALKQLSPHLPPR